VTPRLMLLVSLRAQVDALIAMEEIESGQAPPPGECPHPEERRIVSHNMGEEPQFYCPDCKAFVKGAA
jgi:hypothetical protein